MGLVELMVWVAISLLITTVIGTIYVNSKQVTRVNDTISRLQESGRFAIHLLDRDMRMAGFRGCNGAAVIPANLLNSTAYAYKFDTGLQGFAGSGGVWSPSLDSSISTLSPAPLSDTDVVTIRHIDGPGVPLVAAMTSQTGDIVVAAGSNLAAGDILLVADCSAAAIINATGYNAGSGAISHAVGGAGVPGNTTADLGHIFGTDASVYRLVTRTYYIAPSVKRSGTNTLWAYSVPAYDGQAQPEEMVEGVDKFSLLFGEDHGRRSRRQPLRYGRRRRHVGQCRQRQGARVAGDGARQRGDGAATVHLQWCDDDAHRQEDAVVAVVDDHAAQPGALMEFARTASPRVRQSGMSLFPAMMFLLVLSVLGVSALNSTLMQEKMVSNTKDLNVAFQAAEAGLRDAEADVSRNVDAADPVHIELRERAVHAALDLAFTLVGRHFQGRRLERQQQDARVRRVHRCPGHADGRSTAPIRDRAAVVPPRLARRKQLGLGCGSGCVHSGGSAYRLTVLATGARPETRVVLQSTYIVKAAP